MTGSVRQKLTETQEVEAALLYQSGLTGKQIATKLGVSTHPIWATLKRQGIESRPSRACFRKLTPEKIDAAIQRYQGGERLPAIAKEYGVNVSTLARQFQKRGVEMWPNGYQTRAFTPKQDEEIGLRYEAGEKASDLVAAFGGTEVSIQKAIRRSGRKMRSKKVALRQYHLNEMAFADLTSETAYWIGFLMADGSVYNGKKRKQSWTIAASIKGGDREHLTKLASFLQYDGPIYERLSKNEMALRVSSDHLAEDLARWGLHERKSLCEDPHQILLTDRDYWRGEVDGDGSVYMTVGNNAGELIPAMSLVGGERVVRAFADWIKTFAITKAEPRAKGNGLWAFTVKCGPAVEAVRMLYAGCDPAFALDRKLVRANAIMARWPNGYDGPSDGPLW